MRTTFAWITLFLVVAGCGTSARIVKSWRDPDVTVDMAKLNKVLVVAMLRNETNRRATEDKLVTMLNGKGVASYNVLTKDVKEDGEEKIKEQLKQDGFDGAVIMKLADVEKDVQYVPGRFNTYPPYYGRFWGYYWRSWNSFYEPGYYETTKNFTVETNVYSLTRDKLVWSGISRSSDPENVQKLMDAVAGEVFKKMKKEGFVVNY